jgi:hypothetical protein
LEIRFYGIIIVSGAVLGAWLATREARRRGHNPDIVWDLLIYLMIGGIIGARIWHIFTPSPNILVRDSITGQMVNPYFAGGTLHILDILAIWKGGLGLPGAVIGGAIVLYFYAKANKLNFAVGGYYRAEYGVGSGGDVGEIISTRNCMVHPRTCPGRFSLIPRTGWMAMKRWSTIIRCSSMSRSGTSSICSC